MVLKDETAKPSNTKMISTAKGVTNFGIKVVRTAIEGAQNAIVASISVASVLAMTMLGAKGDTASQLKDSLTDGSAKDTCVSEDNMQGITESVEAEDEVDGMVVSGGPSTHMDSVECVTSRRRETYPAHGVRHGLKSLKKKFKTSFNGEDTPKWSCEDEAFHTKLGEVITFDQAMSSKKAQPPPAQVGYTLKSANRIYIKKNGTVQKGFLSASERLYHSKPEVMNFAAAPEKCRQEINSWVEKQTNSRIKDLIAPGTVSLETSILIVNAIYFKGDWADKFDPVLTRKAPFYTMDGPVVEIDFMFKNEDILYKNATEHDCQVVELPYVGGDVSFVLILPNQTTGLTALESSLDATLLADLIEGLYEKEVIFYLPKFKIEVSVDLADVLQNMGITNLFNPSAADLTGIDPKGNLYVSNIIHKAFIEVNEEGSEAAGATAEILMAAGGAPRRRTIVKADHPFIFLIKDNRSGVTLFLGRYCYP